MLVKVGLIILFPSINLNVGLKGWNFPAIFHNRKLFRILQRMLEDSFPFAVTTLIKFMLSLAETFVVWIEVEKFRKFPQNWKLFFAVSKIIL